MKVHSLMKTLYGYYDANTTSPIVIYKALDGKEVKVTMVSPNDNEKVQAGTVKVGIVTEFVRHVDPPVYCPITNATKVGDLVYYHQSREPTINIGFW